MPTDEEMEATLLLLGWQPVHVSALHTDWRMPLAMWQEIFESPFRRSINATRQRYLMLHLAYELAMKWATKGKLT